MSTPRAIILFIVFLGMLTGCRKGTDADAEQLDRLNTNIQLLVDAFDAVNKEEHELAISRLEKLEESQCVSNLIKREHQNITITKVSVALGKGDLIAAELALNEGIVRTGSTPDMNRAKGQIDGLRRIKEYLHSLPFDEAGRAAEEVALLPKPEVFNGNDVYGVWLGRQHKMLQELIRVQRRRVGAEILNELDLALVKGDDRSQLLRAQLRALDPKHPLAAAVLPHPETVKGIDAGVFDLICFIQARHRGTKRHAEVMALYGKRRPASLCGEYLKADAAIVTGDMPTALAKLRVINEAAGGMDVSRLRIPLNRKLNRASAAAAPNLPALLGILYQLQSTK